MKIKLIVIGKTDQNFVAEGMDMYIGRMRKYIDFSVVVVDDCKKTKNTTTSVLCEQEGELILKKLTGNEYLVLCDENGKQMSSKEFSRFLERKMNESVKELVFIIGGAYGFGENVKSKARESLSLSKMTFSHQLVRVVFLEQLYRAFTIIKGEPYHHE